VPRWHPRPHPHDVAGYLEECRRIMDTERSYPPAEALCALLAVVTADYALSETLSLFIGDPEDRPAGEACYGEAMIRTADWCMDVLQACGRSPHEDEILAQVVAADVLERARTLIDAASPRDAEAFFLSALVLIVDDFCTLWQTGSRQCADTPLPTLRRTLVDCLARDYEVQLDAPDPPCAAIVAAQDLAGNWRSWARMSSRPPPRCHCFWPIGNQR
jgi:hypothetical protein